MPSYEEDLSEFERRNAQVLGISCDTVPVLQAWAKSMGGLSYPLLSDFWPHGKTTLDYAVLRNDDKPFNLEGDTTFRVISSDAQLADLRYDDSHYDHACVDRDLNCVFPIDRIRELASERRLGGLATEHFSLGYSQALRELRANAIPALARAVDRVRPDIVLLTGGLKVWHRTLVPVQRGVE